MKNARSPRRIDTPTRRKLTLNAEVLAHLAPLTTEALGAVRGAMIAETFARCPKTTTSGAC